MLFRLYIITFLLFVSPIFVLSQIEADFSGKLEYSFQYRYESIKDSIYFTNRFNTFFELTGYEINTRKKGKNIFYVKNDTTFGIWIDINYDEPVKYLIQNKDEALIYNPISNSYVSLSRSSLEESFDRNLVDDWRNNIDIDSVVQKTSEFDFKQKRRTIRIDSFICKVFIYKDPTRKVEDTLFVTKDRYFSESQNLPWHFEDFNFRGGLIVKRISKYRGYIVEKSLMTFQCAELINISEAIEATSQHPITLVPLNCVTNTD